MEPTLNHWSCRQLQEELPVVEYGPSVSIQDLPLRDKFELEPLSDIEEDDGFVCDDEDEMLRYAIMLSLQEGIEDASNNVPASNFNNTSLDLSSTFSLNLPHVKSTTMQISALTNLPLELKEMICSYVFTGETIAVKPGKGPRPKLLITWGQHMSILVISREFNHIAMRSLVSGDVVLDLRQFRGQRTISGQSSYSAGTLENLLSDVPKLTSVCSKLLIRQGQHFQCNDLLSILPALTHMELYDYKSCREALRENGLISGSMFEYELPMRARSRATDQLKEFQESVPSKVCADLIYVCDTLVCIPQHEDEYQGAQIEQAKRKGVGNLVARMRHAIKGSDGMKSEGLDQKVIEPTARYKTAKMRHLFLFNKYNPEGEWLSKEWVVPGLGVQSLSLGDIIAIHCHDYCLELIERGETIGV